MLGCVVPLETVGDPPCFGGREPLAVHGDRINGTKVFDNEDYVQRERGAGQVLLGYAA
jgi:hypothetical protein